MHELPPSEHKRLLPRGCDSTYVVLFYRSSQTDLESCGDVDAVAVDLDKSPQIAGWFKLSRLPILAAVFDGALLGLEPDISEEACTRLTEGARGQRLLLNGELS